MPKKKLEDYSTEELKQRRKQAFIANMLITGLLVIYAIWMFTRMISGEWDTQNPIQVLPYAFLLVVIPLSRYMKKVDDHLKERGEE